MDVGQPVGSVFDEADLATIEGIHQHLYIFSRWRQHEMSTAVGVTRVSVTKHGHYGHSMTSDPHSYPRLTSLLLGRKAYDVLLTPAD